MESLNRTRRQLKGKFDGKQDVARPTIALMGQGNGTVEVANQPGYVYFRTSGETEYGIAFNNRCPVRDNLRIYVGYDPVTDPNHELFQVISVSMGDYAGDGGSSPLSNVGQHHVTHEFGGGDDVYVEWRRIMGLRVGRPALFVVTVDPGVIIRAGAHQYIPSTTVDLTAEHAALAGTQACYVLIYMDSAGAIQHLAGAAVASLALLTIANCPIAPGVGDLELGGVRLYVSQTRIGDTPTNPDIWDLRYPASAVWSSGFDYGLTAPRIPFAHATDVFTDSANLTWQDTPQRIEVGGARVVVDNTIAGINIQNITDTLSPEVDLWAVGDGISPIVYGRRAMTGTLAPTADRPLLSLLASGYDGATWQTSRARIGLYTNEAWGVGANGTRIEFWTTPNTTAVAAKHAQLTRGSFTTYYDAANYVSIQPGSTCGALTWTPEISGAVIVRSATPNIVGGAFGATPGNARGTDAVDLQQNRAAAAQVASGNYSVICGGSNNIASATTSSVLGGAGNTASGVNAAVLGGASNIASAEDSVACGYGAQTTHTGAFLFSDSTALTFSSIADKEFALRARGGFRHAYDDNNYVKFAVDSGGSWAATITHAAGTPVFSFDHSITAAASTFITALTDGSGGGLRAGTGSDVLWYRGGANLWQTPDSVAIDAGLNVGTATGAGTGEIKTSGSVAFAGSGIVSTAAANAAFTGSAAGANIYGFLGQALANNTTSYAIGVYGRAQTTNVAFTLGNAVGGYFGNPVKGAASIITTAIGVYIEDITTGSTNYAIYALGGRYHLAGLSAYANNAAAVAGGLAVGDLYRTNGDPDTVCVVH